MDDGACIYTVKGISHETIAFLYPADAKAHAPPVEGRARMASYARLMASAPGLLAALGDLLEPIERGLPPSAEALSNARTALRKATNG